MSIVEKLSGLFQKIRDTKKDTAKQARGSYLQWVRKLANSSDPTDADALALHAAAEAAGVPLDVIESDLQKLSAYAAECAVAVLVPERRAACEKIRAAIDKFTAETGQIMTARSAKSAEMDAERCELQLLSDTSEEARDRRTIMEVQEFELLGVPSRPMPTYLNERMRAQGREEAMLANNRALMGLRQ